MGKCVSKEMHVDSDLSTLTVKPDTSVDDVFSKLLASCGISDASSMEPYVAELRNSWHFRAYDLVQVDDEQWERLALPLIFKNQMFKLLARCRKSEAFVGFRDAATRHQDVRKVLQELVADNLSETTAKHAQCVTEALESTYCCNAEKLERYANEPRWNALPVPQYLKSLLLNKDGASSKQDTAHDDSSLM